ncbi:MAG: CorA family divalent cation transporter, partial [Planctomycetota bacterium]
MNSNADKPKPAKRISRKAGLPPGTLVYIGEEKVENVRITYIDYDEQTFQEKHASNIEECFSLKDTPTVSWINIDGIHEVEVVERIGRHFDLHPLLLEDILSRIVRSEQVSLVLGPNFVISFQESIGDVFEPIRDRIRKAKGRIRKAGPDYLAYALLDAIVDGYFSVLEATGERIESLEEQL